VPQTAVVGEPVVIEIDDHVKDATNRIMSAICACVARAREIYPEHPGPRDDDWWWREPSTAVLRPSLSEGER
jgi:hypothetical protein